MSLPEPVCVGCDEYAANLDEYVQMGAENDMGAAAFVRAEEGTYNRTNGHFLCTACYIAAGSPSSRNGWVAP